MDQPLIFLSHDSKDKAIADKLNDLLDIISSGKIDIFQSSDTRYGDNISLGRNWYEAIHENIKKSSYLICILTKRSHLSQWVFFEAGMAKGMNKSNLFGLVVGEDLDILIPPISPLNTYQNATIDGKHFRLFLKNLSKDTGNNLKSGAIDSAISTFTRAIAPEIKIINTSSKSNSSGLLTDASNWERCEDESLREFYIVIPEYFPGQTDKTIDETMLHNISTAKTIYTYYVFAMSFTFKMRLTSIAKNIETQLRLKDPNFSIDDHLKVKIIPPEAINKLIHRTEIWIKNPAQPSQSALRVIVDNHHQVKMLLKIPNWEVCSLVDILNPEQSSWEELLVSDFS